MCLQLLLSQYSGLKDVIVQTAMAGRVASELEPLIGWFANGAAVRTKLDGGHGPHSATASSHLTSWTPPSLWLNLHLCCAQADTVSLRRTAPPEGCHGLCNRQPDNLRTTSAGYEPTAERSAGW